MEWNVRNNEVYEGCFWINSCVCRISDPSRRRVQRGHSLSVFGHRCSTPDSRTPDPKFITFELSFIRVHQEAGTFGSIFSQFSRGLGGEDTIDDDDDGFKGEGGAGGDL
jgi:hypothetical protein